MLKGCLSDDISNMSSGIFVVLSLPNYHIPSCISQPLKSPNSQLHTIMSWPDPTKPRDRPILSFSYNATKAANRPNRLAPVTPTRRASAALPEAVAEAEAPVPVAVEESESSPEPEAVEEPVAVAAESEPVAVLSEEESPVAWAGVPVEVK